MFKITTGGRSYKVQASGIFVGNIDDLGIAKDTDADALSNGFLDLHIINPTNLVEYVELGRQFAIGSDSNNSPELVMKVKEATIELIPRQGVRSDFQSACAKFVSFVTGRDQAEFEKRNAKLPCMVDGEDCGFTPMRVTVVPQAVNVLAYTAKEDRASKSGKGSAISRLAPVVLFTWFFQACRSLLEQQGR